MMNAQNLSLTDSRRTEFEELFDRYYTRVRAFIDKIIKNGPDSEDLAQDLFVKILSMDPQHKTGISNMDGYIFRTAKNMIYNYLDKKYVRDNYARSHEFRFESTGNETFDYVLEKEMELIISIAVDRMPPQRKKVFMMSRMEGMPSQEIADKLNISRRTVDAHISKALEELRKAAYLIIFLLID